MSASSYRDLLRLPGAAGFFLAAAAGRVGIAMSSLGIVWLVQSRTGSYSTAGLVTGGFAVAEAVAGPQLARLIDRFGQTRVLPPMLAAHLAAVGALLAVVLAGAPAYLMTAGGVLLGVTIPQLGALSSARWAALLRERRPGALPAAFALESLCNSIAYLVGPVLVSGVAAAGAPALGTILAASLVVGGGLALAAQRRTAPVPEPTAAERGRAARSLLRPGFAVLVSVNAALGAFFGSMPLAVTAFTVEHHVVHAAAPLFAVSSFAGLVAAWAYGLRRWRARPQVQLVAATAGLFAGSVPLLVAGSVAALGTGMVLTELMIPVILLLCAVLGEAAVRSSALTQAFTWLNSANVAGSAGAAALAGRAIDGSGARGGFIVAAAAAALTATMAVGGLRALTGRRIPVGSPADRA
jgi:MFS family permease